MAHLGKQLAAVQASAGSASKGMGGLENTSNQASKHLAAVGSSAKTATRGMGGLIDVLGKVGLASIGVGAAASALTGFARGLLGDAIEAQKIAAATDAVVASTQGAAGVSAKAVAELANELSRVAPFEDEAIQGAGNLLLTFTSIGKDIFPLATETVLNMSTALGQDLKSSAIQLGKALNEPIEGAAALRRVGVQLTDAQEAQIKAFMATGDIMSAQKVILKELGTEFGGAARAAGETFAGKLTILQTQLGNVKETIGGALLPVLTQLVDAVMPLIIRFGDWLPGAIDRFTSSDAFVTWSAGISAVIAIVLDGLGGLVGGFGDALGNIWNIVSSIGQAIYEALQWLNPFASHSPALVDQVEEGMGIIKDNFGSITSVIPSVERAGRAIVDFGSMTKDAAKTAVQEMKAQLDDMKDAMTSAKDRVDSLKDAINGYKDTIKDLSGTQIAGTKEYRDKLEEIETQITRVQMVLNTAKMANAAKESLKGLEDQLDKLRLQADNVRLEEKLNLDPLRKQVKELTNPMRELPFDVIVQGITAAQAAQADLAPQLVEAEGLWRSQQEAVKEQEKVLKAAQTALGQMNDAAKGAAGGVTAVSNAAGGLKQNFDDVKQQVDDAKQKFEGMKASVTETANNLVAPIRAIAAPVQELVGSFTGAEGAGLRLHNMLERVVGLDVANFLIGLVKGAQDLRASAEPLVTEALARLPGILQSVKDAAGSLVKQGIARLQQAMTDLAPTGERLGRLFDTLQGGVASLIPKPILDLVDGFVRTATEANKNVDVIKTLTDVVNTVSRAIGDVSKFVQDHIVVQAILVGILGAAATAWTLIKVVTLAQAAATGIVTTVTGLWTAAQWLLNAALTANPIGIVVVALAGLAAALIYAYNNSEEFRQIVDSIATFLQNVLALAIERVRRNFEALTGALVAVNKFQSDVLEALGELAGAALRLAGEIGDNIIQGITNGINAGWQALKDLVGNLARELLKKAKEVLDMGSPSKEFFKVGQFIIDGLVSGLKSRNTTLIDAITSTVGSSINLMESLIARNVGGLNASILSRGASAAESFQKLLAEKFDGLDIMFGFPNLPGIFSQISAASKDAAMVAQIKDVLDAMREMGQTIDGNVIQQFKNLGQELGGPFKEQLDKLLGSLGEQDALKGLKDFLADADLGRQLAATASQLQSLGQAMPDTLKKLLESVPRVGGGILDTIIKQLLAGAIPGFAAGGVVPGPANQPVLAVVHGGERIMPAGGPSGNTYYFNMTVNSQAPVDNTIANFALMRAMVGG